YVAYDAIRQFTTIGDDLPDELDAPDYHFMMYDTIIAYEHRTETAYIISINVHGKSEEELNEQVQQLSAELDEPITMSKPEEYPVQFEAQMDRETFTNQVKRAKGFIENGEATQIVLSQQMIANLNGDPFSFYRHLRSANPSPYMFYIDFTDYLIIGASPESLVQ